MSKQAEFNMDKTEKSLLDEIEDINTRLKNKLVAYLNEITYRKRARKDLMRYYIRRERDYLGSKSPHPKYSMKFSVCNSIRIIDKTAKVSAPIVSGYAGTDGKVRVKSIESANLVDADKVVAESINCDILDAKEVITEERPNIRVSTSGNTKIKIVDNLYTDEESQSDKSEVNKNNSRSGNDSGSDNGGNSGNNNFI